ncbi:CHAT domain-containing protein [uncultured Lacinutrix sp.]|uniref:CHAT domain-containing protein n=1 Tax=uncultured Lacinutrix sp. TaxID=574032 RepID=UPI002620B520|nr:CHAT domain-containing protein [uncultured Lacinutrix sp.]
MRCNLKRFFVYVSLLLPVLSLAQNEEYIKKNVNAIYKNKTKDVKQRINALNSLLNTLDTKNINEGHALIYHKIGALYFKNKNYILAIESTNKALSIRESLNPQNFHNINHSLYNLSRLYKKTGNWSKRFKVLKAIEVNRIEDNKYYKALNALGEIYGEKHDYYKALQYFEEVIIALDINDENIDIATLLDAHVQSIWVYSIQKKNIDLTRLNSHITNIDLILNIKPKLRKKVKGLDNNLAVIYQSLGLYDKVIALYKKALINSKKEKDSISSGILLYNLGALYSKMNKKGEGEKYFNESLRATNNIKNTADVYDNLGYYSDNIVEKISFFEKALHVITHKNIALEGEFVLPTLSEIKNTEYKSDILQYLTDLASALVLNYEQTKNLDNLKRAKKTLILIDELVSIIRNDSSNENSKLFWISKGVNSYILAVKVCHLLNDPESAFYFMEKNKALLLLENIKRTQDNIKLNIPDSLLIKENSLRNAVSEIKRLYNDNLEDKTIKNDYVKRKKEYDNFLITIKETYPKFFNTSKEIEILNLKEAINKNVTKDTNFVEYILNDQEGYGIFCSQGKRPILFEIEDVPALINNLYKIKKQLSKPFELEEDFSNYRKNSYSIFKKIFPFNNAKALMANKKLSVIPDYKLHNLPFEALVDNDTLINDYLINNVEVSYYQSASVYNQIEKQEQTTKHQFVGYAPIYFNTFSLPSLLKSEGDMNAISKLFSSPNVLFKEKASKKGFMSNLNKFKIIHINSHAEVDENNEPWIAFAEEKLKLEELYGLNNQADLVVLDACKTDIGSIERGEGVMSLSRGFFYSGTKSIIASQWNVNEQSNNKILQAFYKNIKLGQTKSNALHNAKLDYLKNHQLELSSPYYWASLTLMGNSEAIEITSNTSIWVISLVIIFGLIFLFLILKKRKTFSQ